MTIHKAHPRNTDPWPLEECMHCGLDIHLVPGGHGPVWVHSETGTVAGTNPSKVYVIHGVADRGNEPVCQFFANVEDRESFIEALPGTYHTMTLIGIDYDSFEVELP